MDDAVGAPTFAGDPAKREEGARFVSMVARRQAFERAVAAEPKKPSKRRLAQLWRAAAAA